MRGEPFWRRSRDETITCGRPPPPGGGEPPLPYLSRPQGEDPLAPDLAAVAPPPAPQLRAGRSPDRAVRCLCPCRPQTLERARTSRTGRPPPTQQEFGQTDPHAAGPIVRRLATGAARWGLVVGVQGRCLRPQPLGRPSLSADRLALAEEARFPPAGATPPTSQGGHRRATAEVALSA